MKADPGPLLPDDSVTRLVGIGPKTADAFTAEGITTVRDLLLHLPRRYEDRSSITRIESVNSPGEKILVRGVVRSVRTRRIPRRRLCIVDGVVDDGSGQLPVIWFNQPWIGSRLEGEPELFLYGQIRKRKNGQLELMSPEVDGVDGEDEGIVPVYPRLGRFGGKRLRGLLRQCLAAIDGCDDPLPKSIQKQFGLPPLGESLAQLHAPGTNADVAELNSGSTRWHQRFSFDELTAFACAMAEQRQKRVHRSSVRIDANAVEQVIQNPGLPFTLTAAQERVQHEIADDLIGGYPMARLVQGDVGSGKTAVAALTLRMVLESGSQVAIMAPTELLAEQHLCTLASYLEPSGHTPRLLVSSMPAAERRQVLAGLADGSIGMVVGTHAVFQKKVQYADLGLVVVDEQHRFGVVQRAALVQKGRSPHLLVMTATPIPRSLALTVYGDLDLSIIDEMPPGRREVRTEVRGPSARDKVFNFLRTEIDDGGRVFLVYPLIEASEEIQAAAVEEHEEDVRKRLPGVEIGVLHGRVSRSQREQVTAAFRKGSLQVLLATTVIEVGVDVPEASVMVIESAQRFGLSQLHQLRGRVGRGRRKSWCILITDDEVTSVAHRRLEVVCSTNDGFEIAEADLEIRGPGQLTGTQQWGPAGFRFASLVRDVKLISVTRELAMELAASGSLPEIRNGLARYHPVESVGRAG